MADVISFLDIPFRLALLSLTFLVLGLAGFSWLLFRGVHRRRRFRSEGKRFRPRYTRSAFGSLVSLLMFTTAAAFFNLALFIRTYSVFTGRTLIARVETLPSPDPAHDFQLALMPANKGSNQPQKYLISGDQWMVEGNVLLWSPELALLGLQPGYKLTRVRGRYLDEGHEITKVPSVYALADEKRDRMWLTLLEMGEFEPWVEAIYGSAVTQFPKGRYEIYVTATGLMVQPADEVPSATAGN